MAAITMPKMSDTMEEGKVIRWLKHEGDPIKQGDIIAEIETDKANIEMEAFQSGVLRKILAKEGETVPVGNAIAELETAGAGPQLEAPERIEPIGEQPPQEAIPSAKVTPESMEEKHVPRAEVFEETHILASPLAKRMAQELGIDLSKVKGTGPNGRITEADVVAYASQVEAAAPPIPSEAPTPKITEAPAVAEIPSEERELNKMRKTLAHRMTESKRTIPHFYVTTEIEMDWAARVRDELNSLEGDSKKVSYTDMVIKACALALAQFPEVNSSYKEDKLIVHKEINVGMAVALEDGLIAPVIRNADKKPLREIAVETKRLAEHARTNTLRSSEYAGATFTVSNLGMFNVESFAAIIDPPQAASLAIGTIMERPVVIDGEITVSKRMKATLSADHRILNGAKAAMFLNEVRKNLESPILLL